MAASPINVSLQNFPFELLKHILSFLDVWEGNYAANHRFQRIILELKYGIQLGKPVRCICSSKKNNCLEETFHYCVCGTSIVCKSEYCRYHCSKFFTFKIPHFNKPCCEDFIAYPVNMAPGHFDIDGISINLNNLEIDEDIKQILNNYFLDYMIHKREPKPIRDPHQARFEPPYITFVPWQEKYKSLPIPTVVTIANVTLHFNNGNESLIKLWIKLIVNAITGKTAQQIRDTFGIINDFTPEEEARNAEEYAWLNGL